MESLSRRPEEGKRAHSEEGLASHAGLYAHKAKNVCVRG